MSMKAIWRGDLYHVEEDIGEGLVLEDVDQPVLFGDRDLILDPTDDQVDAARAGLPIPPDPEQEERHMKYPSGGMNGHRPNAGSVRIAERVRITNGPIRKETNLVRCTRCNEVVTLSERSHRNVWLHGMPEGDIETVPS